MRYAARLVCSTARMGGSRELPWPPLPPDLSGRWASRASVKRQDPPQQDRFEFTAEHALIQFLSNYDRLMRSAFKEVHAGLQPEESTASFFSGEPAGVFP